MQVLAECSFIPSSGIAIIEKKMSAKYVCETCLTLRDGSWSNHPVAVFWTEQAHPQGSNWFGIYKDINGHTMIANAIDATIPFLGVAIDGQVIYSRYRHDYREHNGVFVDGGRDYLRWGGCRITDGKVVKLSVVQDHIEIIDQ
jgi:hypothetical protein